MTVYGFQPKS